METPVHAGTMGIGAESPPVKQWVGGMLFRSGRAQAPRAASQARSGTIASPSACMSTKVVWNGTQLDAVALLSAAADNCDCQFGAGAARLTICAAHRMLNDQRVLDGLLFARHMAARLLVEEFSATRTSRVQS